MESYIPEGEKESKLGFPPVFSGFPHCGIHEDFDVPFRMPLGRREGGREGEREGEGK